MFDPFDPVSCGGEEPGASTDPAARSPVPARPDSTGFTESLIRGLLDALDEGIVVCDAACRPVLVNRAAQAELAGAGALRLEGGRLSTSDRSSAARLESDLREVALGGRRRLLVLPGQTGCSFVALQPAPHGGWPTGLALVLIGRRALCQDPAIDLLAEAHGLTPSERRVLRDLVAGLDPARIATAKGVELSTVRSQIASVRAKLGAASIDDLIRLVARLPAATMAPSLRPEHGHRGSRAAPIAATLAAWMAAPIAGPVAPRAAARAATLAVSTSRAAPSAANRRAAGA